MTKYEAYRAKRDEGYSYREIAEMFGTSYQNVACACRRDNPQYFHWYSEEQCVYPGLRSWMNFNKVTNRAMCVRLGLEPTGVNATRFRDIIRGDITPKKHEIDKLLDITGMTYEECFG